MDSLSEATQSYSGIADSEIDAIVPKNEAVCNHPHYYTLTQSLSSPSSKGFGVFIEIPKQACLLMLPALKASGHWTTDYDDLKVNLDRLCDLNNSIWYSPS